MIHVPIPMPVQPERDPPRFLSQAEALTNRASRLYQMSRIDEALALARRAVDAEHTPQALHNLAAILEVYGRFDEGFPYASEAYHLLPGDTHMRKIYSECLLRMGRLTEAWPIFNRAHARLDWLVPQLPEWQGEVLAGKRLLVFAAGGYGDNFYFLRWVLALRDQGVLITYLAPPALASLARAHGLEVVENWNGNFDLRPFDFDYHAEIHTIPQHLGVTFDSPSLVPYVHVPARPRFHLRRRIGFRWRAGASVLPPRGRSLSLEQRFRIVSKLSRYIDLSDLSGSWLDTARLVASLDLLVTVDTGVCHLACAMGIPTYVVLPGASAWHYPIHRDDHPFYPTLRMFRNDGEGMDSAVDALCEAL